MRLIESTMLLDSGFDPARCRTCPTPSSVSRWQSPSPHASRLSSMATRPPAAPSSRCHQSAQRSSPPSAPPTRLCPASHARSASAPTSTARSSSPTSWPAPMPRAPPWCRTWRSTCARSATTAPGCWLANRRAADTKRLDGFPSALTHRSSSGLGVTARALARRDCRAATPAPAGIALASARAHRDHVQRRGVEWHVELHRGPGHAAARDPTPRRRAWARRSRRPGQGAHQVGAQRIDDVAAHLGAGIEAQGMQSDYGRGAGRVTFANPRNCLLDRDALPLLRGRDAR
jgi:hypothetical protein